ncbi:MAG: D-alanyl-D-alanine carboxypeptidase [Ruminococcaceae bacterium]|nr:D-alanyl-D-alanine carboxypeptidase [Oscillospiraceae bacterium]
MNNRDYQYNGAGRSSRPASTQQRGNSGAYNGQYRQGGGQAPRGNAPRSQSGYPNRGRAPYNGGGRNAPRPGIRTYDNPYAKKRSTQIIIAAFAIVLVVFFLIIILSPKTVKVPQLPDPETPDIEATTPIVEEPEPEPEPVPVYASRTENTVTLDGIYSQNCILIDVENWTVVAEKGGDEKIFPASMTKVMTALITAEHFEDLTEVLTVPAEIIDPLYRANATVAGFFPNEKVTVEDVLYGIILPSGADATGTAAITISGSEEEFAKLMNKKCEELGLENTHFANASGLHDDNHYTTCHDMAVIMRAALENELVRKVLGTYEYTTSKTEAHPDGITIYSTTFSRIHGEDEYDDKISMFAGKTGYTGEAGQCLVTAAKVVETGKEYIQVCAKSDDKWHTVLDTINNYRHHMGVEYESDYVLKSQR